MRLKIIFLLLGLSLAFHSGAAQNAPASSASAVSVPTFTGSFTAGGKQYTYTVAGSKPELGETTTIPTVLVPVALAFDGYTDKSGKKLVIDATPDISKVVHSPIFEKYAFATGTTQYGDAVQRAEFFKQAGSKTDAKGWHTLLGHPRVARVVEIDIPASDGYVLTSRRTGHSLAVVDLEFVQKELFQQLAKTNIGPGELVIAVTKNAMFYPLNDATVCCSWGAYGVHTDASSKSAQAFILGTYLDSGAVPRYADIQTLTEQIAEWMNDPLQGQQPNRFPAWSKPENGGCGGRGEGSSYRFAEPTDGASISNTTPVTMHGTTYHLENVALLPWYSESSDPGTFHGAYSFPDTRVLTGAAAPCSSRHRSDAAPTASPIAETQAPNGHELIGYWAGYRSAATFPLRDVSPQWDVVIVAFAPPVKGSTSTLYFLPPVGQTKEQFKSDIEYLQSKGKKVLISLGGGGEVVTLNTAEDVHNFVSSVSTIVQEYGFDGVDLDLETPSLILNPGDTDFRKPVTPSVVNLIDAMRQMRRHFGPKFMIAEVPEGPQVPAGMQVYGGQFGSFLPVIYGTRDILSFVDVQNYNTPPLGGLDGNYYMPETADYYVAMTEMLLHGFPVGRDPKSFFPPLPPEKVAIGFLAGPSEIPTLENAMRYLIQGKPFAGGEYKLQRPHGYPDFNGAMFWNIQSDRRDNYQMSNAIGSFLHSLPSNGATAQTSAP
ncbi:MAG TPA: chitinase [Acidobacteriaceae bacterium]|jgi:chitinase|nr:chitinase [Acidobacteriaceae bacterium]